MTRRGLISAMALLAIGLTAPIGAADQDRAFVERLVEAINGKNLDKRRALLAPASRPCASGQFESFYAKTIGRQARHTIPTGYRWKIAAIAPDQPPLFADKLEYPVRPTHLLQLDFATGPNSSTTLIVQIANEGGRWYEIAPCPKPEALVAAEAAEVERARQAEKARALASQTSPELKAEVVKLFKEGRRLDAIKRYAEVSGEDTATARRVVELLAGHEP